MRRNNFLKFVFQGEANISRFKIVMTDGDKYVKTSFPSARVKLTHDEGKSHTNCFNLDHSIGVPRYLRIVGHQQLKDCMLETSC